jgi:two-component system, NarL family, invasion response regulator UvrY
MSTVYINQPIRLVIVDDHEMVRKTWKMILQQDKRIQVIAECASGEEAIACAAEHSPDVMLMDINMSPVNGFEATSKITQTYPGIKIIGISINNQPAYVRNMMQMGAKGYVTKNSASDEMMEAIFTVLEGGVYICKDISQKLDGTPY